ncbi:hypothetical protein Pmar_PMAR009006 [Perkinsus marinus ATCC 50983]|uniref:Uncharacterized protein n=1 Tax=Perkinsus marinus (strain ATCC 50983 / TXsc) TaxID=423536 RepID=C5KD68_PERM5|nr:hypothetical protein Pmar_PMAR009006 [Perkinsus marinus ATCC 50983]EER17575.1 hypothetical protein Pmar_PMAR009006 [Perkinsus marinus ATCC 50983]|eukprot:XP_002785779.1 hypothetical protein Pmar_PMAR009006 [Perkinsus marinus ATCC 50983]
MDCRHLCGRHHILDIVFGAVGRRKRFGQGSGSSEGSTKTTTECSDSEGRYR